MPLTAITATEALRKPTVVYNGLNGRKYGATVEALSTRSATPAAAAVVTTTTTGGTIAGTTALSYRYTVVFGSNAESLAATAGTTTTGPGGTNSATIQIPPQAGAEHYALYGRTSGAEQFITNLSASATTTATYVDTGATIASTTTVPSGAAAAGMATLRIHTYPGDRPGPVPRLLTMVSAATAPNQAGKYEYYRV